MGPMAIGGMAGGMGSAMATGGAAPQQTQDAAAALTGDSLQGSAMQNNTYCQLDQLAGQMDSTGMLEDLSKTILAMALMDALSGGKDDDDEKKSSGLAGAAVAMMLMKEMAEVTSQIQMNEMSGTYSVGAANNSANMNGGAYAGQMARGALGMGGMMA